MNTGFLSSSFALSSSPSSSLWQRALDRSVPDAVPAAAAVLWPAAVVLVSVLAWPQARRWGRLLVTVVHEAGHAGAGVLVGRSFRGFVVERDLGGHAVTAGRSRGPGRVLTTWAGYPTPALVGAGLVTAATRGWAGSVLAVAVLLTGVLVVMSRSLRTVGVTVVLLALSVCLWWWGQTVTLGGVNVDLRAGLLGGVGLAMLVGAWDSLRDVARSQDPAQDHRTLASLSPFPAGLWLFTWFLVDGAATLGAGLAVASMLSPA